jgi:hypothetical protein
MPDDAPTDPQPATIVAHWSRHRPDDVALVLDDDRRTWRQPAGRADAVSRAQRADGVGHGDRITLKDGLVLLRAPNWATESRAVH